MAAWRLFCYVDESGLDARSRLLVVAVVVVGEERDALRRICERAEAESGKGRVKWSWAAPDRRINYMRILLDEPAARGKIWFETHILPQDYLNLTVSTIARAIASAVEAAGVQDYKATILIDGLPKAREQNVGRQLHRMGVHTRKVRGIRDESEALIRLADAVCGLARGAAEGNRELSQLLEHGLRMGVLQKIESEQRSPGEGPGLQKNHRD